MKINRRQNDRNRQDIHVSTKQQHLNLKSSLPAQTRNYNRCSFAKEIITFGYFKKSIAKINVYCESNKANKLCMKIHYIENIKYMSCTEAERDSEGPLQGYLYKN